MKQKWKIQRLKSIINQFGSKIHTPKDRLNAYDTNYYVHVYNNKNNKNNDNNNNYTTVCMH